MYLPKHFQADPSQTAELLAQITVADLITPTADGLFATFLPLIHEQSTPSELGSMRGHVARRNDHWRLEPTGESMVIAHGPDAYISPGWYASKREHGRVVPTWNYLTAHIHGRLVIHDDVVWLEQTVRLLTERHEATQEHPWSVDDAPREFTEGQLRAIVGIEFQITRIEAKAKLGQNRTAADIDGAVSGLRSVGDQRVADAMQSARRS
jgi:transcriptional regulator